MGERKSLYERIYSAIEQVPWGQVSTYGDIAAIVGDCDARMVGYALNDIPKERTHDIPWQRIINSTGGISTRGSRQRELLEAEGVEFDSRERLDLARYRWAGPDLEWALEQQMAILPVRDSADQAAQLTLFPEEDKTD